MSRDGARLTLDALDALAKPFFWANPLPENKFRGSDLPQEHAIRKGRRAAEKQRGKRTRENVSVISEFWQLIDGYRGMLGG